MDIMLDVFKLPFMQRALIGGLLVGFLAGYYGAFIVQRRLSFLGSGLAHAAFGGVALGLLLVSEPLWIAIPFTVLVALGIVWVKDKTQLEGDTAVGIFFAVSMALGIIFIFLRENYSAEAFTYLFGSILAVSKRDIWAALIMTLATLSLFFYWKRWAYASFDRELALSDHVPVLKDDYLLSVLIALTIVISIKIVGIVLVAAFLVIPAASARLFICRFSRMTVFAIVIGMISVIAGLEISYHTDTPSGAAIILFQAVVFFLIMMIKSTKIIKAK
jgi:zinc transport system permease protein